MLQPHQTEQSQSNSFAPHWVQCRRQRHCLELPVLCTHHNTRSASPLIPQSQANVRPYIDTQAQAVSWPSPKRVSQVTEASQDMSPEDLVLRSSE